MTSETLTIHPGVAGIVFKSDGQILLHQRRVGDGWAPPSGTVEPGEAVHAALHRELREETRLTVEVQRFVGLYSDPSYQIVQYPDGRAVHFVTSVFACRVTGGRLHGSDEGTEWAWFPPAALPSDMLPYARRWMGDVLKDRSDPVVR